MNYYDRENNVWYDKKIINFLSKISRGKFVSIWDHFINTNVQNLTDNINEDEYFELLVDDLTITKIHLRVYFNKNCTETDIEISSFNIYGEPFKIPLRKSNGKRQYDGTIIYTIDISHIECYDIIYIKKNKEKNIFFIIFLSNL